MEQETPRATITECFSDLEDPRRQNRRHKLLDILVIAICAAISGADGWEDVELFGVAKEEWLKGFLELPHGIPSDDTFRRLFAVLDAEQFQAHFMEWVQAVEDQGDGRIVAADGKTLRRSHDRSKGKKALQLELTSPLSHQTRLSGTASFALVSWPGGAAQPSRLPI